ncbi:MAG: RNA-binding S4 domain-containing protein [Cypionkella sp.]
MAGPGAKSSPFDSPKLRLDIWLFQARLFKGRDLASQMISAGHLRLNGQRCAKPGHAIGPGDVLTFAQGKRIRVLRVLALGHRRGPAPEAQSLYVDLDAAATPDGASSLE